MRLTRKKICAFIFSLGLSLLIIAVFLCDSVLDTCSPKPEEKPEEKYVFQWDKSYKIGEQEHGEINKFSLCLGDGNCGIFAVWSEEEKSEEDNYYIRYIQGSDLSQIVNRNEVKADELDLFAYNVNGNIRNYFVVTLNEHIPNIEMGRSLKCESCFESNYRRDIPIPKSEVLTTFQNEEIHYPDRISDPIVGSITENNASYILISFIGKMSENPSDETGEKKWSIYPCGLKCNLSRDPHCKIDIEEMKLLGRFENEYIYNLIYFQRNLNENMWYFLCYRDEKDRIIIEFSDRDFTIDSLRNHVTLSGSNGEICAGNFYIIPHQEADNMFLIAYVARDYVSSTSSLQIGYFFLNVEDSFDPYQLIEVQEKDIANNILYLPIDIENNNKLCKTDIYEKTRVQIVQEGDNTFWVAWNGMTVVHPSKSCLIAAKFLLNLHIQPEPDFPKVRASYAFFASVLGIIFVISGVGIGVFSQKFGRLTMITAASIAFSVFIFTKIFSPLKESIDVSEASFVVTIVFFFMSVLNKNNSQT